jgi:hypothetical protein
MSNRIAGRLIRCPSPAGDLGGFDTEQSAGGTAEGDVRTTVLVLGLVITWFVVDTANSVLAGIRNAQTVEFGTGDAPNRRR